MKTAYKDLKSKLKNNHGPSSSSGASKFHGEDNNNNHSTTSSNSFTSRDHRRSAPSSPVFSKGPRSSSAASHYSPMQVSMQPSSSSTMPSGAGQSSNYSGSVTTSPSGSGQVPPLSGSTSSSSSMSEINLQLWQELQHHDLFKSPPVDRSVSGEGDFCDSCKFIRIVRRLLWHVPFHHSIKLNILFSFGNVLIVQHFLVSFFLDFVSLSLV